MRLAGLDGIRERLRLQVGDAEGGVADAPALGEIGVDGICISLRPAIQAAHDAVAVHHAVYAKGARIGTVALSPNGIQGVLQADRSRIGRAQVDQAVRRDVAVDAAVEDAIALSPRAVQCGFQGAQGGGGLLDHEHIGKRRDEFPAIGVLRNLASERLAIAQEPLPSATVVKAIEKVHGDRLDSLLPPVQREANGSAQFAQKADLDGLVNQMADRNDTAVEGLVQHDLELSPVHLETPFRCRGASGPCAYSHKMLTRPNNGAVCASPRFPNGKRRRAAPSAGAAQAPGSRSTRRSGAASPRPPRASRRARSRSGRRG